MKPTILGLLLLLGAVTSAAAVDCTKTTAAPDAEASSKAKPASAEDSTGQATVPRMQPSHVAMLSNAFAAKRIGAFNYQVTRLVYEVRPGSRLWTIHYALGAAPDGRKPDPAEFEVLVDDRTGKAAYADR